MPQTPTRPAPRFAINSLAEYLTASAGRRRTLVTDQKRPKPFRVVYYAEAEEAIVACLAANLDASPLELAAARLRALPAGNDWDRGRRDAQMEAIAAFRTLLTQDILRQVPLLTAAPQKGRRWQVSGVQVSVRPELLVVAGGQVPTGALKLYFSKQTVLSEERGRYATAILHYYMQQVGGGGEQADPRLCLVLDVFGRRIHSGQRTFRRRRQDIEAACSEISALWPGA